MQEFTTKKDNGFIWEKASERVWIMPWGKNGVRVRITKEAEFKDLPQGLLDNPETPKGCKVEISDSDVKLTNGEITATLTIKRLGQLIFTRTSDGKELLTERKKTTAEHWGRTFTPNPNGSTWKIEQRFFPDDDEKIYGMGQRQHGMLDQKGCMFDLMHRNTEVSIPFMLSSKGYGFLWNNPGLGKVGFGRNDTRWVADSAHQLDYYVVIDDNPSEIMQRYAEVTGFPSEFPEWGAGFWQCKLRYKTQKELLEVAREYHRRKLPISVIIIDFHHWVTSGDWTFDSELWPDPAEMVRELKSMGIELMVSVWPTVNTASENFQPMLDHGLLLRNERGGSWQNGNAMESFVDSTNPKARKYLWEQLIKGYVDDGIKLFWLDTIEPEIVPLEFDNTRYYLGNGSEVTGLYPKCHQQAFYEGLKSRGEKAPMTLGRSAWVGSQSLGAAVWSADIPSTFESLRCQVNGGLNIALSGIPYWTTDIGGFHGGDIEDPEFHELLIRWFQYGVFCPIMRLHGVRKHANAKRAAGDPIGKADPNHPGVGNEVWTYGEEVCEILSDQILLRDRLKSYIMDQMKKAETTGLPPMRPVFVDFPEDKNAWEVEDQFMFGPDLLVSPVTALGVRKRNVYLPEGTDWKDAFTGKEYKGGTTVEADCPMEHIPVFQKADSKISLK